MPQRSIVGRMGTRIGTGISQQDDARVGAIEAAQEARTALDGAPVDLAVVFASGAHLAAPEATLEGVHEALRPPQLIGCGAGGLIADGAELEDGGTAVAVWAASLGDGAARTFHATASIEDDMVTVMGMEDLSGASGAILLPDPYSFPTDPLLQDLAARAPGVPIIGGLASARTAQDTGALFLGDAVCEEGMVGVRFDGVELLPCV
jgi:small ligand-binding sensory domain FIST